MWPLRLKRIVTIVIAFGGLGCLSLFGGCADETKTTGTQLEWSPEVKADMDSMRGAMKERKKELKQVQVAARKKK
jgi:hypothetical protein